LSHWKTGNCILWSISLLFYVICIILVFIHSYKYLLLVLNTYYHKHSLTFLSGSYPHYALNYLTLEWNWIWSRMLLRNFFYLKAVTVVAERIIIRNVSWQPVFRLFIGTWAELLFQVLIDWIRPHKDPPNTGLLLRLDVGFSYQSVCTIVGPIVQSCIERVVHWRDWAFHVAFLMPQMVHRYVLTCLTA
jgi:hypothetical protein